MILKQNPAMLSRINYFVLFALSLIFIHCSNPQLEQELATTKEQLMETEAKLAAALSEKDKEATSLVHLVYFKLKPAADQNQFIAELDKLKAIEGIQDLDIGVFKDLGDERALSDYAILLSLEFENEKAYQTYQEHEIHLALKANTKDFLAGPPVTYDYEEQE